METFTVEIVTPKRGFPPLDAALLDVPAARGRLTVLPGHEPFVCALNAGAVHIDTSRQGGESETPDAGTISRETWQVKSGTMMVESRVTTLLVREAIPPGQGSPPASA